MKSHEWKAATPRGGGDRVAAPSHHLGRITPLPFGAAQLDADEYPLAKHHRASCILATDALVRRHHKNYVSTLYRILVSNRYNHYGT
jgi:hypothetical protein